MARGIRASCSRSSGNGIRQTDRIRRVPLPTRRRRRAGRTGRPATRDEHVGVVRTKSGCVGKHQSSSMPRARGPHKRAVGQPPGWGAGRWQPLRFGASTPSPQRFMWEPWGCEHPDLWRHPDLAGAAPRGADLDRRSLPVPGVRRAPGGAHQRARGRADRPRRSRDRAHARGPPRARRADRIRPVARRDRTRGVRPRRRSARDHAGRGSSRFPDRARGPPARRRRVAGCRGGRVHRPPAAEVGGGDEGHPPCRRGRAGGDGRRGGDASRGRDRRRST